MKTSVIANPTGSRVQLKFKHIGFIRSGLDDLLAWCRAQQPTEKPDEATDAHQG